MHKVRIHYVMIIFNHYRSELTLAASHLLVNFSVLNPTL